MVVAVVVVVVVVVVAAAAAAAVVMVFVVVDAVVVVVVIILVAFFVVAFLLTSILPLSVYHDCHNGNCCYEQRYRHYLLPRRLLPSDRLCDADTGIAWNGMLRSWRA